MGKKILVIDDDPAFADMVKTALVARGYEVEICLQAPLAFRMIRERRPDLITLDIMMPGRSGWEIVNQMRANAETAEIPVIISTGIHGTYIADEALLLQGMHYEKLYKPFELDELYEKVERFIGSPEEAPSEAGSG